MEQIATVILTFVLTGVVGNFLLQRWQFRTWMHQQRHLGQEREFETLKGVIDDITKLMSSRLYHMKRLLAAARSLSDDEIRERLAAYDKILVQWNEELSSFYVRLTFAGSYYDATGLERRVHEPFVKLGAEIETIVKRRLANVQNTTTQYVQASNQANILQARIFQFSRDLLRVAEEQRRRVYFGIKIPYTSETLSKFSTWELVKSLFIGEVDSHSVVRASADPKIPLGTS